MREYKYFKPGEFQWCSPPCRLEQMDPDFMEKLDQAREIAGVPFHINSAFRSLDYEIKHGRSGSSSHTKGCAADIHALTPRIKWQILSALIKVGFTRFGLYPNFIHVDGDSSKPSSLWVEPSSPKRDL